MRDERGDDSALTLRRSLDEHLPKRITQVGRLDARNVTGYTCKYH